MLPGQLSARSLQPAARHGKLAQRPSAAPSLPTQGSPRPSSSECECEPNAWVAQPSSLSQMRVKHSYGASVSSCSEWWAVLGSNQWPLPCETEVGCLQINDMRAGFLIATRTCCHLISLDITQCRSVTSALSQNCPSGAGMAGRRLSAGAEHSMRGPSAARVSRTRGYPAPRAQCAATM